MREADAQCAYDKTKNALSKKKKAFRYQQKPIK